MSEEEIDELEYLEHQLAVIQERIEEIRNGK
jgi:hypothetical protein